MHLRMNVGMSEEQIEEVQQRWNDSEMDAIANGDMKMPSDMAGKIIGSRAKSIEWIWNEGAKSIKSDIIDGIIGYGTTTLIAGAPGSGKSTIMMSMLEAIQSAGIWAGQKCSHGSVWYFTEEKPRTLYETMQLVGPKLINSDGNKSIHQVWPLAEFVDVRKIMDWPSLADGIIQHYHNTIAADGVAPIMIVIDTLGKWSRVKNTNDYGEMGEILSVADAIAAKTYASVVVMHHARKITGDTDPTSPESVLGSQNIAGTVDQVIVITTDTDDDKVRHIHQAEKRHRGVIDHLAVRMVDGKMEQVDLFAGGDVKVRPDDREIQTLLASAGKEMSVGLIGSETGYGRKKVQGALNRLKSAGYVKHNGQEGQGSAWLITDKSVELVN